MLLFTIRVLNLPDGSQESWYYMNCKHCDKCCIKWGRQKTGCQRWYCKGCHKTQQAAYIYHGCAKNIARQISTLVCESVSIRGIGRVLQIATGTVLKKIQEIAAAIAKPSVPLNRSAFEMDELRTYVGNKENQYWIAYALCPITKAVIDFTVGKRSKRTLRSVVNTLLLSGVQHIKTDKLNIYATLIPTDRHCCKAYHTNHIERYNLNLRTHLKRLNRRTICFSRSRTLLEACVRIYFWGGSHHSRSPKPFTRIAA
jgi:insertion element IS1 protein InsB